VNLLQLSKESLLQNCDFQITGQTVNWFSTDKPEFYQENIKNNLVPEQYQDVTIEYTFNTQGYRTAELDTFREKEFIIAFGCSYTQGVGLHQSEIWCEQLAKLMNTQCMNLALEGTGVSTTLYQTVNYLNSGLPLPSAVFIQHSHKERRTLAWNLAYSLGHQDEHGNDVTDFGIMLKNYEPEYPADDGVREILVEDDYQSGKHIDAITYMWNGVGVPVLHWTYNMDCETNMSNNRILVLPREHLLPGDWVHDIARDCTHNGPVDNINVSKNLHIMYEYLQSQGRLSISDWEEIPRQLTAEEQAQRKIIEQRNRTNILYN